jgi:NAD(P)H-hydrate epimerase
MGMHGAPVLAALSAMRAGAGMVRLAVPAALHDAVCKHLLEIITIPVGDENCAHFATGHVKELVQHLEWADVVLLGPGLGKHPETLLFLNALMMHAPQRMVIDGDGLRFFSPENSADRPAYGNSEILATPHAGEFSRIGGRYCYEKPLELIGNLRQTATKLDINILLKGPTNLLACRDAHCTILPFGDPGLATAGTGDVLAGATTALFCHLNVNSAAGVGVAVHSQASQLAQRKGAALSMMAGDLIHCLPAAFKVLMDIAKEKNIPDRPS